MISNIINSFMWFWRGLNGFFEENNVNVVKYFPIRNPRNIRFESVTDKEVLFMCSTVTIPIDVYVELYDFSNQSEADDSKDSSSDVELEPMEIVKFFNTTHSYIPNTLVYLYKPLPPKCKKVQMVIGKIDDNNEEKDEREFVFNASEFNNEVFVNTVKQYLNP